MRLSRTPRWILLIGLLASCSPLISALAETASAQSPRRETHLLRRVPGVRAVVARLRLHRYGGIARRQQLERVHNAVATGTLSVNSFRGIEIKGEAGERLLWNLAMDNLNAQTLSVLTHVAVNAEAAAVDRLAAAERSMLPMGYSKATRERYSMQRTVLQLGALRRVLALAENGASASVIADAVSAFENAYDSAYGRGPMRLNADVSALEYHLVSREGSQYPGRYRVQAIRREQYAAENPETPRRSDSTPPPSPAPRQSQGSAVRDAVLDIATAAALGTALRRLEGR